MSLALKLLQQDIDAARAAHETTRLAVLAAVDAYKARAEHEFKSGPTWAKAMPVFLGDTSVENEAGYKWLQEQCKTLWPGVSIKPSGMYSMVTKQWLFEIHVRWGKDEEVIERLTAAIRNVVEHITPMPKKRDESFLTHQEGFRIFQVLTDDCNASGVVELGVNLETNRVALFKTRHGHVQVIKEMSLSFIEAMLRFIQKEYYWSNR